MQLGTYNTTKFNTHDVMSQHILAPYKQSAKGFSPFLPPPDTVNVHSAG